MYFYSSRQARYLKFTLFHFAGFFITGPLSAALHGFVAFSILYLFILFLPPDISYFLIFHIAYVITGLTVLPILMRMRRYRRTNYSEIYGRFPKRNSVWP